MFVLVYSRTRSQLSSLHCLKPSFHGPATLAALGRGAAPLGRLALLSVFFSFLPIIKPLDYSLET